MTDAAKLIEEMRELTPLTPEWHAKGEEIEVALGLIEVPPGRFELTDEEIANLPVLDLSEFLGER